MKKFRIFKGLNRYINGTQGVISLFLALLMVPFVTVAGALINFGRINSAVALFDEALCNASNSTLGTYDSFLRERFGLMAMSQNTSSGGTQFGSISANYTADALINDLFVYYMEKNLDVLSNTYDSPKLQATGLYPLGDRSVLLASVLQAGKYTVPGKLAIDWFSLDDMLAQLTQGLKLFSSLSTTISSGANVASDVKDLTDKQDKLEKLIDECNTLRDEYTSAYNEFISAVNSYNTLIDNINSARNEVNRCQEEFNRVASQKTNLDSKIEAKRNEIKRLEEDKDASGRPINHAEEIERLKKELEELEKQLPAQGSEYNTANTNLQNAKSTLNSYINQLPGKRQTLSEKKTAYYTKIIALRDKVDAVGDAAVSFQQSAKKLVDDGVTFVSDAVSSGYDIAKNNNKKRIEELNKENELYRYQIALAQGDENASYYTGDVTHYYNMIEENKSAAQNLQDQGIVWSNGVTTAKEKKSQAENGAAELAEFADEELREKYQTIYDALSSLAVRVDSIAIPENQVKLVVSDCYYTVVNPVEKARITQIIESIEESITKSAGWAFVSTVFGFIKAMLSVALLSNVDLNANINEQYYNDLGGLPSKRNYTSVNPFEAEDSSQSQYYKTVLNSFASNDVYTDTADVPNSFEQLTGYILDLVGAINPFKLRKIPRIAADVAGIISVLSSTSFSQLASELGSAIGKKVLLLGYVSYNTANRTTYSGSALTGASFSLPTHSTNAGYAFMGAETEYIYNGSMSEEANQKATFKAMWFLRAILDIIPIMTDTTIMTIASDCGAATFGIGFLLVIVGALLFESFIDTSILAFNGDIPMLKTTVYLSPAGVPKLLEQITHLSLPKSAAQDVYEKSCDLAYQLDNNTSFPSFPDYQASQKQKITDCFSWDYTKSLQILLMFRSSDTLIKRLGDIIQMEATQKAKYNGAATYKFDLNKSYTFLRVSGSFTSDVFIRISEDSSLNSQKRVIYKGY